MVRPFHTNISSGCIWVARMSFSSEHVWSKHPLKPWLTTATFWAWKPSCNLRSDLTFFNFCVAHQTWLLQLQITLSASDLLRDTKRSLISTWYEFWISLKNSIENQTTWKSALKVSKRLWVSKMFDFQHPAGAPVLPAACAQESNSVPKPSFMVPAWLGQAQNGVASDGIVPNRDISWLIEGLGSNSTPKYTEHKHLATWHFLSLVPLHKSQFPTTVIVVATQFPRKTPIKLQNPWINLT